MRTRYRGREGIERGVDVGRGVGVAVARSVPVELLSRHDGVPPRIPKSGARRFRRQFSSWAARTGRRQPARRIPRRRQTPVRLTARSGGGACRTCPPLTSPDGYLYEERKEGGHVSYQDVNSSPCPTSVSRFVISRPSLALATPI